MGEILRKNIDKADEVRTFDKGTLEIVTVGDVIFGRAIFEPGWRWSESVKPIVGGDSCQHAHKTYVLSGRLEVRLDDGTEMELGPGDVAVIPAGHDAWVVGDESCVAVDFDDNSIEYAKPTS